MQNLHLLDQDLVLNSPDTGCPVAVLVTRVSFSTDGVGTNVGIGLSGRSAPSEPREHQRTWLHPSRAGAVMSEAPDGSFLPDLMVPNEVTSIKELIISWEPFANIINSVSCLVLATGCEQGWCERQSKG